MCDNDVPGLEEGKTFFASKIYYTLPETTSDNNSLIFMMRPCFHVDNKDHYGLNKGMRFDSLLSGMEQYDNRIDPDEIAAVATRVSEEPHDWLVYDVSAQEILPIYSYQRVKETVIFKNKGIKLHLCISFFFV